MNRLQNYNSFQYPTRPRHSRKPKRRKKTNWKFKISWLLVPLSILALAYIVREIELPFFTWNRIMNMLNVRDRERFTRLCVLALILIGIVGAKRILNDDKERDS